MATEPHQAEVDAVLVEAWCAVDVADVVGQGDLEWEWTDCLHRVYATDPDTVVQHVLRIMEEVPSDSIRRRRLVVEAMSWLLQKAPDRIWPFLRSALLNPETGRADVALASLLRPTFPEELLFERVREWVDEQGRDAAAMAARIATEPSESPTSIGAMVLDRYPNDKVVASILGATLFSGSWSGPIEGFYASRLKGLEQLAVSSRRGVARWASAMLREGNAVLDRARAHDENQDVD